MLDCFAGSGSTALAALRLGRRAIAMEIAPQWAAGITKRVFAFGAHGDTVVAINEHDARRTRPERRLVCRRLSYSAAGTRRLRFRTVSIHSSVFWMPESFTTTLQ